MLYKRLGLIRFFNVFEEIVLLDLTFAFNYLNNQFLENKTQTVYLVECIYSMMGMFLIFRIKFKLNIWHALKNTIEERKPHYNNEVIENKTLLNHLVF